MKARWLTVLALSGVCGACVGTTGGEVVDFEAAAAGPEGAQAGVPMSFASGAWQVNLTTAELHVGAVYLDATEAVSGAEPSNCILPGTYVAQVTTGLDVDLLSSTPQSFPELGHGTTLFARTAEVWLTRGPIDSPEELTTAPPILTLIGTATRASDVRPFTAHLTISASNRLPTSGMSPFASPICKQRVVSPIATRVQIETQGGLLLRIDPRFLFVNVDFAALAEAADGFAFNDDARDQPSANLYQNLRSAGELYQFSWQQSLIAPK